MSAGSMSAGPLADTCAPGLGDLVSLQEVADDRLGAPVVAAVAGVGPQGLAFLAPLGLDLAPPSPRLMCGADAVSAGRSGGGCGGRSGGRSGGPLRLPHPDGLPRPPCPWSSSPLASPRAQRLPLGMGPALRGAIPCRGREAAHRCPVSPTSCTAWAAPGKPSCGPGRTTLRRWPRQLASGAQTASAEQQAPGSCSLPAASPSCRF